MLAALATVNFVFPVTGEARAGKGTQTAVTGREFFSPNSFWNRPLSSHLHVDRNSARIVEGLLSKISVEEAGKVGPYMNVGHLGLPIITVPSSQRTVRVTLARLDGGRIPALSAAWAAVPLPRWARPSEIDGVLVILQPSTDRMWEFLGLIRTKTGWKAHAGGAMQHMSTNPGVYGPDAWLGAQNWWGVTATSLPIVGGVITIDELRRGEIDHALSVAIPNPRAGVFASPAERTDGNSHARNSIPEGALLRLDPRLNLRKLRLPPLTLAVAQAAQRYGIYVRDYSPEVAFLAQDQGTASDPYWGPNGLLEGKEPEQLLAVFPWKHLQVVKMQLHPE